MEAPIIAVFTEVILPVFFIFICGFVLQKIFRLDLKPISTLAVYLLLPFLVFETFYETPLDISFLYIAVSSVIITAIYVVIGLIVGRGFRYSRKETSAFMLSTVFPNSGNYGIPIVLFAFGEQSLVYAMPVMIMHTILMGIVGVYFAANGQGGMKTAIGTVLRQPSNWVIIPAILMQEFQIHIPGNFYQSVEMIGDTTIPVVMVILGMQLANVTVRKMNWGRVGLATFVRLALSPLIAFAVCLLFPMSDLLRNVIIVMSAMPSAANTTLYAIQFNTQPRYVSSCTLITTVLSLLSLTVLLNVL